ncbi:complement factor B-like [Hyla sarda]|uniref:complement factor B-like n=1 Tax=Hyla sarda TaxID=327740 RepID=UPI0024C26B04|nr:complement factor B-like [Hyla sarda]XP_056396918.1 complement factor B-like [Hyla sarda]
MLLPILLSQIAMSIANSTPECDLDKIAITGGEYTLTNGGNVGSIVQYTCPEGKYPYPSSLRECLPKGQWTDEQKKAQCKVVQCPRPVMFENGELYPRKMRHFVGDVLHFDCWGGFKMIGPQNRTCQENGKWSGEETKCDDEEGDCPNPGIPLGATKVGSSYKIENKVTYQCQPELYMYGSKERVCMENKRWSGAEPTCRYSYTFDTPKEVAETFSASLSETIESSDLDKDGEGNTDRTIRVETGGDMNIFIVIDASKSVGLTNFNTAKKISEVFIDKMASFDFIPRYGVISYASFAKSIMLLSDDDSNNAEEVIEKIRKFQYKEHDDKQGTNTRAALAEVHNMLSLQHQRDAEKFMKTRNVILLMTDGKHNMGGDPAVEVKRIREFLDIRKDNNREDFLDIYVFGLGNDISDNEINDIASKKDPEKHVFKMRSIDDMKKAFDDILDESEILQMCGLSKETSKDEEGVQEKYPWIAKITITRPGSQEKCKGSIVSRDFILTAAHCFHLDEELHTISVRVGDKSFKAKELYRHPQYDPVGKNGVEKSFDYDMALIQLDNKMTFSKTTRPICLPCTSGTSWALKQRGKSVTCKDHESTILPTELEKALFIAEEKERNLKQMNVHIKQGNRRLACLEDTKKIEKFKDIPDIKDLITDNFLCTGGIEPQVDPQTCKGDSGGPLIVQYKQRFIQVGIISWGTISSCNGPKRNPGPVPALSRDFHADVFKMLDWLKEKMPELEFIN